MDAEDDEFMLAPEGNDVVVAEVALVDEEVDDNEDEDGDDGLICRVGLTVVACVVLLSINFLRVSPP